MNENAVKIQIALSALEGLNVPATENNANHLQVIWQMLKQVRDNLNAAPEAGRMELFSQGEKIGEEVEKDGEPETE